MKNRLYYILYLLYAIVVAVILYINGVFSGTATTDVNLVINLGFLVIIGILFIISGFAFARLNRCSGELASMADRMAEDCRNKGVKNLWGELQNMEDVFADDELEHAFDKYRRRMKKYQSKRGYTGSCDIDEFINEDLLDKVGMNFFNSGISGTMTGLGILGTFLGLSMGLGAFNGDDIYAISDNVGALLSGMKVAFHTSVYGIFFSIIFNFIYRSIMSDAYEKLEYFQASFRQHAMPSVVTEDENSAAMVIYQASMSNALRQLVELMKGNAEIQTKGVEQIVNRFTAQMTETLGVNFQQLGGTLKSTSDVQMAATKNSKDLVDASSALLEANKSLQAAIRDLMDRQEKLAMDLNAQKELLANTCSEMSNEISNQLYAFEQMRNMYEK